MCIFHKWTKWQEYQQKILFISKEKPVEGAEMWQKRNCIKCGYTQRREVVNR